MNRLAQIKFAAARYNSVKTNLLGYGYDQDLYNSLSYDIGPYIAQRTVRGSILRPPRPLLKRRALRKEVGEVIRRSKRCSGQDHVLGGAAEKGTSGTSLAATVYWNPLGVGVKIRYAPRVMAKMAAT